METKLQAPRLECLKAQLGFGSVFVVDCVGRSGGLGLLCSLEIDVTIQNYSRRHINAVVRVGTLGQPWKFTGFYGHPEITKRKEAWSLLQHLKDFSSRAWLCIGDFNEIVSGEEKSGERKTPRWQMDAFKDTLEVCQLIDLGYTGPLFTWSNKREDRHFTQERLDRALSNLAWTDLFPNHLVEVMAARSSDHSPLSVTILRDGALRDRSNRRFSYEASWGKMRENKEAIKQGEEGNLRQKEIQTLQDDLNELLFEDEVKWKQRAKEH
ncbi:uncharacterized protein LOC132173838 [Corylus avellana]|uniref:uncharacterized protein LOC132173838 n=1 Tax=Corylus avellana TaxID=13451 RepID=UPI00286B5411|nr:uncharacterized protein LOC132173838 [Corylus avellana]